MIKKDFEYIESLSDQEIVEAILNRDTVITRLYLYEKCYPLFKAEFSPDGRYIMTKSTDHTVKLWGMEGKSCVMNMEHDHIIENASFSPDGKYIVTSSWDRTAKLWSIESGNCVRTMYHDDYVTNASFSPDGKYIVTTSSDGMAKLWSSKDLNCIMTMNLDYENNSVVFSPGSKYMAILSSSSDVSISGTAHIYKLKSLSEILDKWSEILGPNAELTEEEKGKYYLN